MVGRLAVLSLNLRAPLPLAAVDRLRGMDSEPEGVIRGGTKCVGWGMGRCRHACCMGSKAEPLRTPLHNLSPCAGAGWKAPVSYTTAPITQLFSYPKIWPEVRMVKQGWDTRVGIYLELAAGMRSGWPASPCTALLALAAASEILENQRAAEGAGPDRHVPDPLRLRLQLHGLVCELAGQPRLHRLPRGG